MAVKAVTVNMVTCHLRADNSWDHVHLVGQDHSASDQPHQGGSHTAGKGKDEGICPTGWEIWGKAVWAVWAVLWLTVSETIVFWFQGGNICHLEGEMYMLWHIFNRSVCSVLNFKHWKLVSLYQRFTLLRYWERLARCSRWFWFSGLCTVSQLSHPPTVYQSYMYKWGGGPCRWRGWPTPSLCSRRACWWWRPRWWASSRWASTLTSAPSTRGSAAHYWPDVCKYLYFNIISKHACKQDQQKGFTYSCVVCRLENSVLAVLHFTDFGHLSGPDI